MQNNAATVQLPRGAIVKALMVGFSTATLTITAYIAWLSWDAPTSNILNIGSFVVSSLTLVVLGWYALDTNTMARITKQRWAREGVLSALYDFDLIGQRGTSGKTLVRFHNRSDLLVRAKAKLQLSAVRRPDCDRRPLQRKEEMASLPATDESRMVRTGNASAAKG